MSRLMGIFSLFKSKKQSFPYEFSEEDRYNSAEVRKLKQQMRIEQLKLENENIRLEAELRNAELRSRIADLLPEGEMGDDIAEQMFMPIIQNALGGKGISSFLSNKNQTEQPSPTPARASLTDEQLRDIRDSLPSGARKFAKTAPDSVLSTIILQQIPALTQEELSRALVIARE